MVVRGALLSLSALLLLGAHAQREQQQQPRYIIELEKGSTFLKHLNDARVHYQYDSDLFYGASVEFASPARARAALARHEVVNSWSVMTHQHPAFSTDDESTDRPQAFDKSSFDASALGVFANYTNHDGNDGTSVRVGIIDSGVDYRHPALGGCFGDGCKIAYGYDLVGSDYPASVTPDDDPLDDCPVNAVGATGHGTFVSGIIAADDKSLNWTGVAPGVKLGMWRVFGCNSQSSTSDVFMKAMEMAYKADMDIINISLGTNGGWAEDALSVLADRLVAKGVHVVVAVGNIGTSGIMLTAAPATAHNVISVGSQFGDHVPGFGLNLYANNDSDYYDLAYRTATSKPLQVNRTRLVASSRSFNASSDGCQPYDSPLHGAVLVHDGGCSLHAKALYASRANASALIIYTDTTGTATTKTADASLPIAFVNHGDGKILFDALNTTATVELTTSLRALKRTDGEAGWVAGFTSLGPTNELELKPEIIAPGSNLFSTLPLRQGGYGLMSGTSMSSPYVAGTVARMLTGGREVEPAVVKDSLMNFAKPNKAPVATTASTGDSPLRQGAGVINYERALAQPFRISPAKLSFNDTEHINATQTLTIYNNGETDLKMHLVHGPALTVTDYASKDDTPLEPIRFAKSTSETAKVAFDDADVTVPAGSSVKVQVHVTPPSGLPDHAIYGGYIGFETRSMAASVPYIGMVGSMADLAILDRSNKYDPYPFPSIGYPNGTIVQGEGYFAINDSTEAYPVVLARLLTGTPLLELQVLDQHQKVLGVVPYDLAGETTREWLPRNTRSATSSSKIFDNWSWSGEYTTADGKENWVEPGLYYLRMRALHVFGDRSNDDDWDTWTSPKLHMARSSRYFSNSANTTAIPTKLSPSAAATSGDAEDIVASPPPSGMDGFSVSVGPKVTSV
ncbi:peptidase S8/S53 domain-containing protein [Syncephalastrum racemosum]|uniref:Peptidase S8/S53 domain-containing protein n=1 Tax=Syncephalastrum racemosum TaxID=13706 RepID=A0A1X2HQP7_SYNRA|nr:peptidase S8/S53 domain-containing protein [Syncephalastrum racemosum]